MQEIVAAVAALRAEVGSPSRQQITAVAVEAARRAGKRIDRVTDAPGGQALNLFDEQGVVIQVPL